MAGLAVPLEMTEQATSRNLCGNWQGNKLPGEVLWEDEE
jgi:hypothetical protein